MRIAFVYLSNFKDWPSGGMLSYVRNLLPYFYVDEKSDIEYWGCSVNQIKRDKFAIHGREYNLNLYSDVKTSKKIIPNFFRSFLGIIRASSKFRKYDILYSHTSATTIGLKLTHPTKFVVHHQHGLSYVENKSITSFLNIGYMIAQKLADMSFFVASENELMQYQENHRFLFRNKRFYSIGSPVELIGAVSHPVKKKWDGVQFIYTGRLTAWKNVGFILEAYKEYLSSSATKSRLFIVGEGVEKSFLEAKSVEIGISSNVIFTGNLDHAQVIEYLQQSDVFLFSSKGEGVSVSILEALSCGIPVVACNAIGVNNLVLNGITGYLVERNINDFAEKMISAVENKASFYDKCRCFAEKFESVHISERIMGAINNEYHNKKNITKY